MDDNEKKYFGLIFEHLEKTYGFHFNDEEMGRKYLIFEDRLKANRISSFQDFHNLLTAKSRKAKEELQILVNKITNNNTSFFRYRPSFELLEKIVLPELFTSRFVQNNDVVKIWSVGCATGEEAYSIAMSCLELLPDSNPVKIEIIATDISTDNLNKAQQGYFSKSKVSSLSEPLRKKYFSELIGEDGILTYVANKALKKLISFRYLNLADSNVLFPNSLDIIFCRNVFTYLKKSLVMDILERFHHSLISGGYLFTSATDHPIPGSELFKLISNGNSTCFKKESIKEIDKLSTSISIENKIPDRSVLNKKRLDKKNYKIARVRDFISKLNSAHDHKNTIDPIQSLNPGTTFLGFKLNDKLFCVDVKEVREIVHAGYITSVPSSPAFVKGIMNYRGNVLTLVDISRFLNLSERSLYEYDHLHIMILNMQDCLMGIIISSYFTTFTAKERDLNITIEHTDNYIKGIFNINNESYKLLKIDDLVSSEVLDVT